MKQLCAAGLIGLCFFFVSSNSRAQGTEKELSAKTITSHKIAVGYYKTTNLIFPYAIKSVDRGSGAVIVQKAKGVENILQVKAGKKDFEQTNLSVVTADRKFYSFLLNYDANPPQLNFSFEKEAAGKAVQFTGQQTDEQQFEQEACRVFSRNRFIGIRESRSEILLVLNGIFLSDKTMWFRLQLKNFSQIGYRPDYVRFFLRDKKRSKRTALQETEIFPLYSTGTQAVKGMGTGTWLAAFEPFTIPDNQRLIIQTGEQNGGRSLTLTVKNKTVLRARQLD